MKIRYEDLTEEQRRKIPRTTLWRAKKRGYLVANYHSRWENIQANPSADYNEEIDMMVTREARQLVSRMLKAGYPYPTYMDEEDLIRECVDELWRISAKPGFRSRAWRFEIMRRVIKRIASMTRFDRDGYSTEPIEPAEYE